MPFARALVQKEMLTALSMVWTWVIDSISCDYNRHAKYAFFHVNDLYILNVSYGNNIWPSSPITHSTKCMIAGYQFRDPAIFSPTLKEFINVTK